MECNGTQWTINKNYFIAATSAGKGREHKRVRDKEIDRQDHREICTFMRFGYSIELAYLVIETIVRFPRLQNCHSARMSRINDVYARWPIVSQAITVFFFSSVFESFISILYIFFSLMKKYIQLSTAVNRSRSRARIECGQRNKQITRKTKV